MKVNYLQAIKVTLLIIILAEEIKRVRQFENTKCDVIYIKKRFKEFDGAMESVRRLAYAYTDK